MVLHGIKSVSAADPISPFNDGVAARTIYGEARGEPEEGKLCVGWVIRNRMAKGRWGTTPASVCLAPVQFSCWNLKDPNRRKLLEMDEDDDVFIQCMTAWKATAVLADETKGSMWYRVIGYPANWAVGKHPVLSRGHHEFYNDID